MNHLQMMLMVTLCVYQCWCCVTIYSVKGRVGLIPLDADCSYLLNGNVISVEDLTAKRLYGLIQASCGDCVTSHVSKFEGCDDCWICAHNEGINECRSKVVPVTTAVIITLSTAILMSILAVIIERYCHVVDGGVNWLNDKLNKKRALKENRRTKRIRRILEKCNDLPNETDELPHSTTHSTRPLGGAVTPGALLALGLLAPSVRACDDVLFVSASGGLYTDGSLSVVSTGLAYLHTGNTLCFKHENGLQEELKVDQISIIENYGASYKTCDFKMDFRSYSSCLGSDLCWNAKECHQGARYSKVGPKAYTLPGEQVSCRLVPNMDDPCTYRQKCVWLYWDILPIQDKCDTIYHLLVHFI